MENGRVGTPENEEWFTDVRLTPETTQTCASYAMLPSSFKLEPLFPPRTSHQDTSFYTTPICSLAQVNVNYSCVFVFNVRVSLFICFPDNICVSMSRIFFQPRAAPPALLGK